MGQGRTLTDIEYLQVLKNHGPKLSHGEFRKYVGPYIRVPRRPLQQFIEWGAVKEERYDVYEITRIGLDYLEALLMCKRKLLRRPNNMAKIIKVIVSRPGVSVKELSSWEVAGISSADSNSSAHQAVRTGLAEKHGDQFVPTPAGIGYVKAIELRYGGFDFHIPKQANPIPVEPKAEEEREKQESKAQPKDSVSEIETEQEPSSDEQQDRRELVVEAVRSKQYRSRAYLEWEGPLSDIELIQAFCDKHDINVRFELDPEPEPEQIIAEGQKDHSVCY